MSTTLASFRLDTASGELTLINKVDTGIDIPAHLITDRAGRFLLTAYYEGGGITVHRLDDDGAIGDLVQRIDTGPRAHAVLLTEDERFVFVPHVCPNNKTSQFRFDASTGQLAPNDPPVLAPPAGDPGPRHICFRPLGDVAYIVNEQATHSPPTASTPRAALSPSSKTFRPCPRTTQTAGTPPTSKSTPMASGVTHPIAATTASSATTSTPRARSAGLGTTQCRPARARSTSTQPAPICTAPGKPPTA